ncbi:MAG: flagellin [Alphaproteobacteria bacterium]|nr:flagellin [Alphaproteobacteria bacterium]
MSLSVNTNAAAFSALQNLSSSTKLLNQTQSRLNTGLSVGSSKDNAAVFSIAQKLRGDIAGLNAANASMDRAMSSLDVAIAAGEAVQDILIEMKDKATAAKDAGLDTSSRQALDDDFQELLKQINSIVENAEFNGTNMVDGGQDIVAITDDTGDSTITVSAVTMTLGTNGGSYGTIQLYDYDTIAVTSTTINGTQSGADVIVGEVESSITNVSSALSDMGAAYKRLELQKEFTNKLSNSIETGIGNLVDADLAKESATLNAVQTRQQLGLQALSIANQGPQAVLSLFR